MKYFNIKRYGLYILSVIVFRKVISKDIFDIDSKLQISHIYHHAKVNGQTVLIGFVCSHGSFM